MKMEIKVRILEMKNKELREKVEEKQKARTGEAKEPKGD